MNPTSDDSFDKSANQMEQPRRLCWSVLLNCYLGVTAGLNRNVCHNAPFYRPIWARSSCFSVGRQNPCIDMQIDFGSLAQAGKPRHPRWRRCRGGRESYRRYVREGEGHDDPGNLLRQTARYGAYPMTCCRRILAASGARHDAHDSKEMC